MEVVGAAASVIAITTLVKDLFEICNKLRGSLDKASKISQHTVDCA
jgi:hypothetical protein